MTTRQSWTSFAIFSKKASKPAEREINKPWKSERPKFEYFEQMNVLWVCPIVTASEDGDWPYW